MAWLGAIELGGTKVIAARGDAHGDVVDQIRIHTGDDPDTTLAAAAAFLADDPVSAVGIAAFGPLELRRDHADYGRLRSTPKPGWSGTDLVGAVSDRLGVPVSLDTDVNAAALAEGRWGSAVGHEHYAYITVGTGIGGGIVSDGRLIHGLSHPELGHIPVERASGDQFEGVCPYHGSCLEGMASGPAAESRFGQSMNTLPADSQDEAVGLIAGYVAQGVRSLIYTFSPSIVVIGGGVSHSPRFHERVETQVARQLAEYGAVDGQLERGLVVPPHFEHSGLHGALALAADALAG